MSIENQNELARLRAELSIAERQLADLQAFKAHNGPFDEAFLQDLLTLSDDIFTVWDVNKNEYVWANRRLAYDLGYDPEDLTGSNNLGHRFWREQELETRDRFHADLRQSKRGEVVEVRLSYRHKDGSVIQYRQRGRLIAWNEAGQPTYALLQHTDRVTLDEHTLALSQQQESYEKLLNQLPVVIELYDETSGELQFITTAIEELLGYSSDEFRYLIKGQRIGVRELIHKDDLYGDFASLNRRVREKLTVATKLNLRMRHKDGRWIWVRRLLSYLPSGLTGEADGAYLIISADVTDEHELTQTLSSVAAQLPIALGVFDNNQRAGEYTPRNLPELLGYSRADWQELRRNAQAKGVTAFEWLTHPDDLDDVKRFTERRFSGAVGPFEITARLRHADGSWRFLRRFTSIINPDDEPAKFKALTIHIDVTKELEANETLKLANELILQSSRLKDEFLATMSHELRTPLNAVLGLAEAVRIGVYGDVNPSQIEALQSVEQSGRHLLNLLNDVLDLAKVESGNMALNLADTDIEVLCLDALQVIRPLAREKNLRVVTQFDLPFELVKVDERRLTQVIINLLSNAVKFTPDGGTVSLLVQGQPEEQTVEIEVVDTGIGIPPEEHQHVFQSFVQVDSGLNRSEEGSGLGLALAYQFVKLHGGSISLASEVGKGSRFSVRIPWREASGQAVGRQPTLPGSPRGSKAILVEDSLTDAREIMRYLGEMDIDVTWFNDGLDIVQRVLQLQPDVILLDILLPKQSGWTVLNQLKANPKTAAIPVVILSVLSQSEKALSHGAAAYLQKPVRAELLRDTMMTVATGPQAELRTLIMTTGQPVILLAEDNEMTLAALMDFLKTRDFRVLVARNGLEAVELAVQEQPDLVLMDIQMPEMDGLQAIRKLRQTEGFATKPILAVTALAMPGDRETCLEAGATDYFTKPLSLMGLLKAIENNLPALAAHS